MTRLSIQPASDRAARDHYRDTIESPVQLDGLRAELGTVHDRLLELFPSGQAPLWGVVPGRSEKQWSELRPGDIALFTRDNHAYAAGTIALTFRNAEAAEQLWGRDGQGRTWEYMYALDEMRSVHLSYSELARALGYKPNWVPQGFLVPEQAKGEQALAALGYYSDRYEPPTSPQEALRDAKVAARTFDEELDKRAETTRRTEQTYLKKVLLPGSTGTCDLCGQSMPREFLIAAHIKKRAMCEDSEKTDIPNVAMLACVFGCDHLYERGYVTVGDDGRLHVSGVASIHPVVRGRLDNLHGKRFGGDTSPDHHFSDRAQYFAWHRANTYVDGQP